LHVAVGIICPCYGKYLVYDRIEGVGGDKREQALLKDVIDLDFLFQRAGSKGSTKDSQAATENARHVHVDLISGNETDDDYPSHDGSAFQVLADIGSGYELEHNICSLSLGELQYLIGKNRLPGDNCFTQSQLS